MRGLRPPIPVRSEAEHRLLGNSFAAGLRRLRVHREEYAALCDALRGLARHWRGCDLVDREVAAALQELASALRDMIPVLVRAEPGRRDELEDMASTIGRLIRDCYRSGP